MAAAGKIAFLTRMARAGYHHGDLKQALLDTSLTLLDESGVSGLTLQKAAKRQGVSAAAVYRHYASKEELLAAIAEQGFTLLRDAVYAALDHRPRQSTRALFRRSVAAYIDLALRKPHHYELMFGAAIPANHEYTELRARGEEAFEGLLETVRVCQAEGLFKRRKPIVMAFQVRSTMHGFVMLHIAGRNPFPIDDSAQLKRLTGLLVQFLRRGLERD